MTQIDLAAIDARQAPRVTLLREPRLREAGEGTAVSGFSDSGRLYVEVAAHLKSLSSSDGDAGITVVVEQSDDGNSWETVEQWVFTQPDGRGRITVDGPSSYLRVSWSDVTGRWSLQADAIVAEVNAAGSPGGPVALDDLTDVDLAGAADGDVLTKDGSEWKPAAPSGGSQPLAYGLAVLVFEETAGAGTYTAELPLAGDYTVIEEFFTLSPVTGGWDADTVRLNAWDEIWDDNDPAWVASLDLKTELLAAYDNQSPVLPTQFEHQQQLGGKYADGVYVRDFNVGGGEFHARTQPGVIYRAANTITAQVVTTGAGGTTGRLEILIKGFGVPAGVVNAVKT